MSSLKVILYNDDTVGLMFEEGTCLIQPMIAVQIAQSLIQVAQEADPTLDVEAIRKEYMETHRPLDATLN